MGVSCPNISQLQKRSNNKREIFSGLDFWAYTIYRVKDGKIYVDNAYAETHKVSKVEIDTNTGTTSVYKDWYYGE